MPFIPIGLGLAAAFGLGLVAKQVAAALAPPVARASRPVVKATIRQSVLMSREIKRVSDEVREEIEDITAEAIVEANQVEAKGPARQPTTGRDGGG